MNKKWKAIVDLHVTHEKAVEGFVLQIGTSYFFKRSEDRNALEYVVSIEDIIRLERINVSSV